MAAAARGLRRLAPRYDDLLLALPGLALVLLALESGGFSPGTTAVATLITLGLLLLRTALTPRPLEGASLGLAVTLVALGAFAVWVLLSQIWSDSTSRAVIEYARVVLYLATLALFGLLGRTDRRASILVGGLAAAAAALCVAALAVWLVPDRFPVDAAYGRYRLNWPISYWNAMGLVAAVGAILCVHLACARGVVARVAGAAGVPLLSATLFFTVSRGATAAVLAGIAAYVLVARRREMFTGLPIAALGAGAGTLIAAGAEVESDRVTSEVLADPARAGQLALVALGAGLLRAAVLPLDRRIARARLPRPRPIVARGAVAGVAVAAVVVFVAAGGPAAVERTYDRFVSPEPVFRTLTPQERFTQLQANGRIEHWDVALEAGFEPRPLTGSGAGTYPILWGQERTTSLNVLDGHSLYVETLGELGLIGLALLLAVIVAILLALARRAWTARGGPWPALLAAGLTWAVHAGIDWDWELPALTAWFFAAGGLALAAAVPTRSPDTDDRRATGLPVRVAVAAACVALALVPLSVGRSQVRLIAAVEALQRGDCRTASEKAADSRSALGSRPETYEILAYCALGSGRAGQALELIDAALRRDPDNWELHYARALALGAAGRDPRASARQALELNPRAPLAQAGVQMFDTSDRTVWRREAMRAALPVPPLEAPVGQDPSEEISRPGVRSSDSSAGAERGR
jgi:hypothetical protein